MLNKVILIGRTTREPELRYTTGGHPVATFTLAVDRSYVGEKGERDTDFIKVVAWRKLGEAAAQHLGKGRLIAVEGRLQIDTYEKDGSRRVAPKVVAENIRYLSWPKKEGQNDEVIGDQETAELWMDQLEV